MSKDKNKKRSAGQALAQERRRLVHAADQALNTTPAAQNATDVYFALVTTEEDLQDLRGKIIEHARKEADNKRFWTAFGANTPLVAGLLLLEPISGTLAVLSTIFTGYAPTVLIKRILDDNKMGEAAALKSVEMEIETIDILAAALKERRDVVAGLYAKEMLADKDHRLFKHYRELTESFQRAARRQPAAATPAKIAPRQKRFGP